LSGDNVNKSRCASLFDIRVIFLFHVIGIYNNFAVFVFFVAKLSLPSEFDTHDISLLLTIVGFVRKSSHKFLSVSLGELVFVSGEVAFQEGSCKRLEFGFKVITNGYTNSLFFLITGLSIFPLSETLNLSALVSHRATTTHVEEDFIFVIGTSVIVFGVNNDLIEIILSLFLFQFHQVPGEF